MFFANENNIISNFDFFRWMQAFGVGAQYPFLYPLWFLRNLFILNLLAIVIKKIIDYAPQVSFVLFCVIFLFVPCFPFDDFAYLLSPFDLCMWCLGYFFVKNKWNLKKYENSKILFVLFILSCAYRLFTKNIDIPWVALYRVCILIALLFWYTFFTKNTNGAIQKIFLKISSFNFGIYIFHEMNLSFGKKLIVKLLGSNTYILVGEYLLLPMIIVFGVIILCTILKKHMPKLYSVLTGSRV